MCTKCAKLRLKSFINCIKGVIIPKAGTSIISSIRDTASRKEVVGKAEVIYIMSVVPINEFVGSKRLITFVNNPRGLTLKRLIILK